MQFWDRDSFVDGPIRSLLYMLESEYPFHTVELIRLLSALCSGMWSAECVYVISLNVQIIAYMNCNFFLAFVHVLFIFKAVEIIMAL